MELKIYDKTTCPVRISKGKMSVRIVRKNGALHFNKCAVQEMGLTRETNVLLLQDQKDLRNWYITTTTEDVGFELKGYTRKEYLTLFSRALVDEVLKSTSVENSATFPISNSPVEHNNMRLHLIITANPQNSR